MRRLTAFALVLPGLALLFLQPGTAYGHAALVRSEPAANSFLQRPPAQVSVTFSEKIDSRASRMRVLNALGSPIPVGPLAFSQDGLTMTLPVGTLSPGIYNVAWSNVSSVDGHALAGSFPFTVLKADGGLPDQANTVSGVAPDADPAPLADGVAVRGLGLLGLLIVTAAGLLVLLGAGGGATGLVYTRMAAAGAALLFVSALLSVDVLHNAYSGVSLGSLLFRTRPGSYLVARMGAALFIGSVLLLTESPRGRAAACLAGVAVSVVAFSATSHGAAGTGSSWGTALDFLHRLAALAWIGAVTGLAVTARAAWRDGDYAKLMPRFSLLASILVFTLVATGSLSAFIELDTWDRFTSTRYGTTLLWKLGLLVPLLSVAYYNSRWGRRRLVKLAPGEPRRFIATAAAEIALGLAVFFAAAVLTQTTTAKSILDSPDAKPYGRTSAFADLKVTLDVDPNRTGLNTYRITLADQAGRPVEADRVRLTFRYLDDQSLGPSTLALARAGAGVTSGQGPYFTLEGNWRIEVEVRRADVDDVKGFFDVRPAGTAVNNSSRGGAWDNPAPGLTPNQFAGFATLLLGFGFAIWGARLGSLHRYAGWGANGVTVAGIAIGVLLLFGVHSHAEDAVPAGANPVFPDQNSIDTGRGLYAQNCAACHGERGVPPKGLDLNPYPLDLTVHVPQHPDAQLFQFISNGIPGSAMRAWSQGEGKLSDDQTWHLVNFLRTLTPVDK